MGACAGWLSGRTTSRRTLASPCCWRVWPITARTWTRSCTRSGSPPPTASAWSSSPGGCHWRRPGCSAAGPGWFATPDRDCAAADRGIRRGPGRLPRSFRRAAGAGAPHAGPVSSAVVGPTGAPGARPGPPGLGGRHGRRPRAGPLRRPEGTACSARWTPRRCGRPTSCSSTPQQRLSRAHATRPVARGRRAGGRDPRVVRRRRRAPRPGRRPSRCRRSSSACSRRCRARRPSPRRVRALPADAVRTTLAGTGQDRAAARADRGPRARCDLAGLGPGRRPAGPGQRVRRGPGHLRDDGQGAVGRADQGLPGRGRRMRRSDE